jgi:hypothetical protein
MPLAGGGSSIATPVVKYVHRKRLPLQHLADCYGIKLPTADELPPSYSMRMWLTRRIATMHGRHQVNYQRIKADPDRLAKYKAATKERVRRWRAKHRDVCFALASLSDQNTARVRLSHITKRLRAH